ncbi:MAG: response regulator [Pseudomonadota bacterium]|nr:response regulator [Pseudomonadota bacterium]
MKGLRQLPIRHRMLLVGAVPALLVVLVMTAYHMLNRWSDLRQENQSIAQVILEHIGASAEYPIVTGNYDLLRPLMDAALAQPAIVAVDIYDASGHEVLQGRTLHYDELTDSDVRWLSADIRRQVAALDEFSEFGDERLVDRSIGSIRLGMSDYFTRDRELDIMQQSLLTGLVVVALAVLISYAASASILSPLEKLAGFIARLAGGRIQERLQVDDGAEIGHLQVNANTLAESLEKADHDQQQYTAQLVAEQQKTQQASRAKSDFLAMMSHELRTPLNGAIGMLQLLDKDNSREEFEDYKRTADQSLTHLTQLLEDVLVVVDTEKNRMSVSLSDVSLPQVLDNLVQSFRGRALDKKLSLVVDYDDSVSSGLIRSDPSLVRQIVRHLVDNALKFTEDGMVVVQLSLLPDDTQNCLCIRVCDTGIGIEAEKKQLVLEAFSQANSSFNRRYSGIGLGLTITSHICRVLGGRFELTDAQGGGTCATALIPALSQAAITSSGEQDSGHQRALIVEDNPVNLKVLEKMLLRVWQGIEVTSVTSGEACLTVTAQTHFDLIFMDCQMPGLDGFETTRRLREQGVDSPVVACTANTADGIRERCQQAGMNDYLAKPLKVPLIRQVLQKWLAGKEKSGPPQQA